MDHEYRVENIHEESERLKQVNNDLANSNAKPRNSRPSPLFLPYPLDLSETLYLLTPIPLTLPTPTHSRPSPPTPPTGPGRDRSRHAHHLRPPHEPRLDRLGRPHVLLPGHPQATRDRRSLAIAGRLLLATGTPLPPSLSLSHFLSLPPPLPHSSPYDVVDIHALSSLTSSLSSSSPP